MIYCEITFYDTYFVVSYSIVETSIISYKAVLLGIIEHGCEVFSVECRYKVTSFLNIISYAIYGAVCYQLSHFSSYDSEIAFASSYYRDPIGNMIY